MAPHMLKQIFQGEPLEEGFTYMSNMFNLEPIFYPVPIPTINEERKFEIKPSEAVEILSFRSRDRVRLFSEAYHLVHGGLINNYSLDLITKFLSPMKNNVLHLAACYGNDNIVDLVTKHKPYFLFELNNNNDSVLHVAARSGHISTVKKLLAIYANIERSNIKNAWLDYTPKDLYSSEDYDHKLNMKDLLNFVKMENNQGNTLLHEAMLCGKKQSIGGDDNNIFKVCEMYQTLDASGKSLSQCCYEYAFDIVNHEKKSVLYLAVENQNMDAVKLILKKCPERKSSTPKGFAPIIAAILKCDQEMINIILINCPKWIHSLDKDMRLPLHYAASIGYFEGVDLLLSKCTCCTTRYDRYGFFPIHLASYGGHVKVVKKLLKYCPDPTEMLQYSNGRNILHIASNYGKHEVVKYILQSQIREHHQMINQTDIEGDTPLHLASRSCHPTAVYYLISNEKVDVGLINKNNETALDVVTTTNQFETSSLRQHLTWIAHKSAGAKHCPKRVSLHMESKQETKLDKDINQSNEKSTKTEETNDNEKSTKTEQKQNNEKVTERYKDRIENLTIVSTLIVTASVAACFAVPGEADGKANNLHHAMFQAFIILITISLFSSFCSTIILFWATLGLTEMVIFTLKIVMPLLGVALISLSLAFMAGLYTVISELTWLANVFLAMTLIFIVTVILLYALLFLPSSSTFKPLRHISHYPFLFWASHAESKTDQGAKS